MKKNCLLTFVNNKVFLQTSLKKYLLNHFIKSHILFSSLS